MTWKELTEWAERNGMEVYTGCFATGAQWVATLALHDSADNAFHCIHRNGASAKRALCRAIEKIRKAK